MFSFLKGLGRKSEAKDNKDPLGTFLNLYSEILDDQSAVEKKRSARLQKWSSKVSKAAKRKKVNLSKLQQDIFDSIIVATSSQEKGSADESEALKALSKKLVGYGPSIKKENKWLDKEYDVISKDFKMYEKLIKKNEKKLEKHKKKAAKVAEKLQKKKVTKKSVKELEKINRKLAITENVFRSTMGCSKWKINQFHQDKKALRKNWSKKMVPIVKFIKNDIKREAHRSYIHGKKWTKSTAFDRIRADIKKTTEAAYFQKELDKLLLPYPRDPQSYGSESKSEHSDIVSDDENSLNLSHDSDGNETSQNTNQAHEVEVETKVEILTADGQLEPEDPLPKQDDATWATPISRLQTGGDNSDADSGIMGGMLDGGSPVPMSYATAATATNQSDEKEQQSPAVTRSEYLLSLFRVDPPKQTSNEDENTTFQGSTKQSLSKSKPPLIKRFINGITKIGSSAPLIRTSKIKKSEQTGNFFSTIEKLKQKNLASKKARKEKESEKLLSDRSEKKKEKSKKSKELTSQQEKTGVGKQSPREHHQKSKHGGVSTEKTVEKTEEGKKHKIKEPKKEKQLKLNASEPEKSDATKKHKSKHSKKDKDALHDDAVAEKAETSKKHKTKHHKSRSKRDEQPDYVKDGTASEAEAKKKKKQSESGESHDDTEIKKAAEINETQHKKSRKTDGSYSKGPSMLESQVLKDIEQELEETSTPRIEHDFSVTAPPTTLSALQKRVVIQAEKRNRKDGSNKEGHFLPSDSDNEKKQNVEFADLSDRQKQIQMKISTSVKKSVDHEFEKERKTKQSVSKDKYDSWDTSSDDQLSQHFQRENILKKQMSPGIKRRSKSASGSSKTKVCDELTSAIDDILTDDIIHRKPLLKSRTSNSDDSWATSSEEYSFKTTDKQKYANRKKSAGGEMRKKSVKKLGTLTDELYDDIEDILTDEITTKKPTKTVTQSKARESDNSWDTSLEQPFSKIKDKQINGIEKKHKSSLSGELHDAIEDILADENFDIKPGKKVTKSEPADSDNSWDMSSEDYRRKQNDRKRIDSKSEQKSKKKSVFSERKTKASGDLLDIVEDLYGDQLIDEKKTEQTTKPKDLDENSWDSSSMVESLDRQTIKKSQNDSSRYTSNKGKHETPSDALWNDIEDIFGDELESEKANSSQMKSGLQDDRKLLDTKVKDHYVNDAIKATGKGDGTTESSCDANVASGSIDETRSQERPLIDIYLRRFKNELSESREKVAYSDDVGTMFDITESKPPSDEASEIAEFLKKSPDSDGMFDRSSKTKGFKKVGDAIYFTDERVFDQIEMDWSSPDDILRKPSAVEELHGAIQDMPTDQLTQTPVTKTTQSDSDVLAAFFNAFGGKQTSEETVENSQQKIEESDHSFDISRYPNNRHVYERTESHDTDENEMEWNKSGDDIGTSTHYGMMPDVIDHTHGYQKADKKEHRKIHSGDDDVFKAFFDVFGGQKDSEEHHEHSVEEKNIDTDGFYDTQSKDFWYREMDKKNDTKRSEVKKQKWNESSVRSSSATAVDETYDDILVKPFADQIPFEKPARNMYDTQSKDFWYRELDKENDTKRSEVKMQKWNESSVRSSSATAVDETYGDILVKPFADQIPFEKPARSMYDTQSKEFPYREMDKENDTKRSEVKMQKWNESSVRSSSATDVDETYDDILVTPFADQIPFEKPARSMYDTQSKDFWYREMDKERREVKMQKWNESSVRSSSATAVDETYGDILVKPFADQIPFEKPARSMTELEFNDPRDVLSTTAPYERKDIGTDIFVNKQARIKSKSTPSDGDVMAAFFDAFGGKDASDVANDISDEYTTQVNDYSKLLSENYEQRKTDKENDTKRSEVKMQKRNESSAQSSKATSLDETYGDMLVKPFADQLPFEKPARSMTELEFNDPRDVLSTTAPYERKDIGTDIFVNKQARIKSKSTPSDDDVMAAFFDAFGGKDASDVANDISDEYTTQVNDYSKLLSENYEQRKTDKETDTKRSEVKMQKWKESSVRSSSATDVDETYDDILVTPFADQIPFEKPARSMYDTQSKDFWYREMDKERSEVKMQKWNESSVRSSSATAVDETYGDILVKPFADQIPFGKPARSMYDTQSKEFSYREMDKENDTKRSEVKMQKWNESSVRSSSATDVDETYGDILVKPFADQLPFEKPARSMTELEFNDPRDVLSTTAPYERKDIGTDIFVNKQARIKSKSTPSDDDVMAAFFDAFGGKDASDVANDISDEYTTQVNDYSKLLSENYEQRKTDKENDTKRSEVKMQKRNESSARSSKATSLDETYSDILVKPFVDQLLSENYEQRETDVLADMRTTDTYGNQEELYDPITAKSKIRKFDDPCEDAIEYSFADQVAMENQSESLTDVKHDSGAKPVEPGFKKTDADVFSAFFDMFGGKQQSDSPVQSKILDDGICELSMDKQQSDSPVQSEILDNGIYELSMEKQQSDSPVQSEILDNGICELSMDKSMERPPYEEKRIWSSEREREEYYSSRDSSNTNLLDEKDEYAIAGPLELENSSTTSFESLDYDDRNLSDPISDVHRSQKSDQERDRHGNKTGKSDADLMTNFFAAFGGQQAHDEKSSRKLLETLSRPVLDDSCEDMSISLKELLHGQSQENKLQDQSEKMTILEAGYEKKHKYQKKKKKSLDKSSGSESDISEPKKGKYQKKKRKSLDRSSGSESDIAEAKKDKKKLQVPKAEYQSVQQTVENVSDIASDISEQLTTPPLDNITSKPPISQKYADQKSLVKQPSVKFLKEGSKNISTKAFDTVTAKPTIEKHLKPREIKIPKAKPVEELNQSTAEPRKTIVQAHQKTGVQKHQTQESERKTAVDSMEILSETVAQTVNQRQSTEQELQEAEKTVTVTIVEPFTEAAAKPVKQMEKQFRPMTEATLELQKPTKLKSILKKSKSLEVVREKTVKPWRQASLDSVKPSEWILEELDDLEEDIQAMDYQHDPKSNLEAKQKKEKKRVSIGSVDEIIFSHSQESIEEGEKRSKPKTKPAVETDSSSVLEDKTIPFVSPNKKSSKNVEKRTEQKSKPVTESESGSELESKINKPSVYLSESGSELESKVNKPSVYLSQKRFEEFEKISKPKTKAFVESQSSSIYEGRTKESPVSLSQKSFKKIEKISKPKDKPIMESESCSALEDKIYKPVVSMSQKSLTEDVKGTEPIIKPPMESDSSSLFKAKTYKPLSQLPTRSRKYAVDESSSASSLSSTEDKQDMYHSFKIDAIWSKDHQMERTYTISDVKTEVPTESEHSRISKMFSKLGSKVRKKVNKALKSSLLFKLDSLDKSHDIYESISDAEDTICTSHRIDAFSKKDGLDESELSTASSYARSSASYSSEESRSSNESCDFKYRYTVNKDLKNEYKNISHPRSVPHKKKRPSSSMPQQVQFTSIKEKGIGEQQYTFTENKAYFRQKPRTLDDKMDYRLKSAIKHLGSELARIFKHSAKDFQRGKNCYKPYPSVDGAQTTLKERYARERQVNRFSPYFFNLEKIRADKAQCDNAYRAYLNEKYVEGVKYEKEKPSTLLEYLNTVKFQDDIENVTREYSPLYEDINNGIYDGVSACMEKYSPISESSTDLQRRSVTSSSPSAININYFEKVDKLIIHHHYNHSGKGTVETVNISENQNIDHIDRKYMKIDDIPKHSNTSLKKQSKNKKMPTVHTKCFKASQDPANVQQFPDISGVATEKHCICQGCKECMRPDQLHRGGYNTDSSDVISPCIRTKPDNFIPIGEMYWNPHGIGCSQTGPKEKHYEADSPKETQKSSSKKSFLSKLAKKCKRIIGR